MIVTKDMTEAELADYYNRTRDTSDFDGGRELPITVRRNVTISVRFSEEEITALRARADAAGAKVTSYIRAAALDAADPVDREKLSRLALDLAQRAHDVAQLASRGLA